MSFKNDRSAGVEQVLGWPMYLGEDLKASPIGTIAAVAGPIYLLGLPVEGSPLTDWAILYLAIGGILSVTMKSYSTGP